MNGTTLLRKYETDSEAECNVLTADFSEFDRILSEPENQYWFQLKPGKMLRE
jgi:alpha-ketoglutarate-dependent taurine dioxygenase